ncbi:MAG: hypothetical protein Tsb002_34030 [Wenzhouxiangellaceae bacterium]
MACTRTVGFPLYQGATLLDFAGATQVFGFAEGFEAVWLAAALEPVLTTENVSVMPTATFDDHPDLDLVFVPGGSADGVIWAMNDPGYQAFIKRNAATAEWVGSVCVGAFILAAAGVLDGVKATTYWSQLHNLALFPAIDVDTRNYPRYLPEPVDAHFSGGGVSSSIDLALAIVQQLAGVEIAHKTQLGIQYAPNPPLQAGDPGQAPAAITAAVRASQQDSFIQPIRQAVLDLLNQ